MKMTSEQRTTRIAELERELMELRRQDNEQRGIDHAALLDECRTMKHKGETIAAVRHYRSKTGNGLREAHDVVQAL